MKTNWKNCEKKGEKGKKEKRKIFFKKKNKNKEKKKEKNKSALGFTQNDPREAQTHNLRGPLS